MSAKSTKGTQVLGKALCVASAEFFLQACSEIFDGIWDRKLKLCFSESQDNNNNNNNNNNDSNNEEKILLTTMLNVKILFTIN